MSIPRNITGLSGTLRLQSGEAPVKISTADTSANGFQDVLKGLLADQKNPVNSTSLSSTLTQDQLKLLIQAVQIQMNSRLYNSVLGSGLETNILAQQVLQRYSHPAEAMQHHASKISQQMPKKSPSDPISGLDGIITDASRTFNVDEKLIRSVIKAESNYRADATSNKGAMGLMQLMPDTARELGVNNAYDVRENVLGGTRYLKMLLERYQGNVDLALAAYNWGMGNLERNPKQLPRETLNYVAKVNSYYKNSQG